MQNTSNQTSQTLSKMKIEIVFYKKRKKAVGFVIHRLCKVYISSLLFPTRKRILLKSLFFRIVFMPKFIHLQLCIKTKTDEYMTKPGSGAKPKSLGIFLPVFSLFKNTYMSMCAFILPCAHTNILPYTLSRC